MVSEDRAPSVNVSAFTCPHCGVYAHQMFGNLQMIESPVGTVLLSGFRISQCGHCSNITIWQGSRMVFPDTIIVPSPNADLNQEIQDDYREAAAILSRSPRGAAALLRLCVQKLCRQLGEPGKNIYDDIASLVRKGLPVTIQQALDIVRVIGNDAVHPGQIDITDDPATAQTLFRLVNLIAQNQITDPREAQELYDTLPQEKRDQIARRDESKTP